MQNQTNLTTKHWFESNISIPFPLSNGSFARLYVPPTMSIGDAKRLKRMVNALYINGKSKPVNLTTNDEMLSEERV